MNLWISPQDVRDYAKLDGTSGRYTDGMLGSNIRAAQTFIERETSRQFDNQLVTTKTFSTDGAAQIAIPDLRNVTSVTLQSTALVSNTTYWLIPDVRQSGVYVAIQLRPFGSGREYNYLSNPEWFERNLDNPRWTQGSGLPNDLVIVGDWGWTSHPDDLLLGVKAYATWITKRADAVLANAVQTSDGTVLAYDKMPVEVNEAIFTYRRGTQAALI